MTAGPVVIAAFCCSVVPAALFVWNMLLYREPTVLRSGRKLEAVSVLVPARNEERSIRTCIESVLASQGIDFELIVLDDASTDRTAAIVGEVSARDSRLRLDHAPPLPAGWNGKQHACYTLARLARHPVLCFLDADVRLAPDALARMAEFLAASRSDLVSGFPLQETGSTLEWLLLPLIHFVLLAYLPLAAMRATCAPGFAAGCGQFLMARRSAYVASGGHAEIRGTMHDGLLLPALFRRRGFRMDIADLTALATCRMYHGAGEVWRGLSKNATEGLAAPARIAPFTLLLFGGQILPVLLALWVVLAPASFSVLDGWLTCAAVVAAFVPRMLAAWRYRQPWISVPLHPVGIGVLLALQWSALGRKLTGQPSVWKQRAYTAG